MRIFENRKNFNFWKSRENKKPLGTSSHSCDKNTGERNCAKRWRWLLADHHQFFTFSLDRLMNYESAALRLFIYQRKEAFKWPRTKILRVRKKVNDVIFCGIRNWSRAPLIAFEFSRAVYAIHPWAWKGYTFALSWFKCVERGSWEFKRQKSIVNPPTPTNTSLSILTTLFAIKSL